MTRRHGWGLAGAVVAAVLAVPLFVVLVLLPADDRCPLPSNGAPVPAIEGYTDKQLALARMTIEIGRGRGVDDLGVTAALLAAVTESDLRNLANTNVPESLRYDHDAVGADHDSVGPWQLRASLHGSGGIAALMNPAHQANWFYDQLDRLPGWPTMAPTAIAQAIERSAKPDAYADDLERVVQLFARLAPLAGIPARACLPADAPSGDGFGQRVLAAARKWIGAPYVWGGGDENGPTGGGFDCSGLVLHAVHAASAGQITLPHYTQAQQDDPRARVIPLDQRRPGDLIYFTAPGQRDSHHVAIYAGAIDGTDMVLHAATFGIPLGYAPLSQWDGERADVRRFDTRTDPHQPRPPASGDTRR